MISVSPFSRGGYLVLTFLTNIRPVFETLYFVATFGIAIATIYALKQIGVLRHSIRIQSARDALRVTSDQITLYLEKIIPSVDMLYEKIEKHNVKFFDGWTVNIENEEIIIKHVGRPNANNLKSIDDTPTLNMLEAFSTYFVTGLADSNIAFSAVGKTYLNTTKRLMPLIKFYNENGYYSNIIKLFIAWENKRNHEQLSKDLKNIEEKINSYKEVSISPIGTEHPIQKMKKKD
jgi:hypothetical protein